MKRFLDVPLMLTALLVIPIAPLRAQVVVMHSFAGGTVDGDGPNGALLEIGSLFYGTTESGGNLNGSGTVFAIGTDGGGYSVLHTFGAGIDGSNPFGSLAVAQSALFGTTANGGAAGQGTTFKIGMDGSGFGIVHNFIGSPSDGSLPQGSLTLSGSTFFGGSAGGGSAGGGGTLFKTNADGSGYLVLHSFAGGANDGLNPIFGAPAISGTAVYGMTLLGGSANNGVVYRMATDGSAFTVLHSFTIDPGDGLNPEGSVIVSGSTIFGMTSSGGSSFDGTIFKMGIDGSNFTLLHSFGGSPNDGRDPLGELLLSGSTLFGTTYFSGSADLGTMFSMGIDGSNYDVMHSFLGRPNDGANPASDLTLIGSTFYGTTVFGGSSNDGTVFSFTPVPEPSSLLLLSATGSLAILFRRRWISRMVRWTR